MQKREEKQFEQYKTNADLQSQIKDMQAQLEELEQFKKYINELTE